MSDQNDKKEISKQWDNDPCGAVTVQDHSFESPDFFRAARQFRYTSYGPWFNKLIRFEQWQNKKILEIGVGLGSDHFRFARNSNRMTALDLSMTHLALTRRHLLLEGRKTDAVYGDAENMVFRDNTFDLVYSFGVLHHTPDIQKAVDEVYRVLKPGGSAIIALYHKHSVFYWIQTILVNGIIRGGLFTHGYKKLMSQIEYRQNRDSATPIVNVLSKNQCLKLYARFNDCQLDTCHIESQHFGYAKKLADMIGRPRLEKIFKPFGWYIVARLKK